MKKAVQHHKSQMEIHPGGKFDRALLRIFEPDAGLFAAILIEDSLNSARPETL